MASIVIISLLIRPINQRCGQKLGLAGIIIILFLVFCSLLFVLCLAENKKYKGQRSKIKFHCCLHDMHAGIMSLEVQFLTGRLKTWRFRLQGLPRKGDHL